jgi:hypothetical protein
VTGALTCGIDSPIDIVFTWVDGSDPTWRSAFERWNTALPSPLGRDARDPSRYRDNGELRFALRSVWSFAPWARSIHIVTAGHVPHWLRPRSDRVHIVAHEQILSAADLPTFNSHAIEARLHHIPGLAEHFIYFNDDVFLARAQPRTNYFDEAGVPRTAMEPPASSLALGWTEASCDHSARNGIRLIEQDAGASPACRPCHGPFPQRRSHLYELEARFGPQLAATASHRFRDPSDVSLPSFLAPMHGLVTGRARTSPARVEAINVDDADLSGRLGDLAVGGTVDAFCLNDTERVPTDPSGPRRAVTTFLEQRFARPAPWEVADRTSDAASPRPAAPGRRPRRVASPTTTDGATPAVARPAD